MEDYNTEDKCIFCERTENEFSKDNYWTEEHIIPESLGNSTLKLYSVCKDCNSGLGTFVDSYFVNHILVKIIRQQLGLKGQSGKIPNAFIGGIDNEGNRYIVNENYQPTIISSVEQDENKIKIIASSKKELKEIVKKKCSRMGMAETEIQKILDEIDNKESILSQPEIQYYATIEFNRFFMEALKIAYEFAILKLGNNYLSDPRAKEIQSYLRKAIEGKMKAECPGLYGVRLLPKELQEAISTGINLNCHMVMMHSDANNKLIVDIILFMSPALSFSVLVSENASNFNITPNVITEIVDIQT